MLITAYEELADCEVSYCNSFVRDCIYNSMFTIVGYLNVILHSNSKTIHYSLNRAWAEHWCSIEFYIKPNFTNTGKVVLQEKRLWFMKCQIMLSLKNMYSWHLKCHSLVSNMYVKYVRKYIFFYSMALVPPSTVKVT